MYPPYCRIIQSFNHQVWSNNNLESGKTTLKSFPVYSDNFRIIHSHYFAKVHIDKYGAGAIDFLFAVYKNQFVSLRVLVYSKNAHYFRSIAQI